MTGLPITMFLIPACRVLAQLLVNLMVMGWFMGCVDCVANLRMILRFGTNVTPFLQAMHFFYGLNAFVSPMIASPFLLNIDCSPFIDGYTVNPEEHTVNNQSVTIAPQPKVVDRAMQLSHSKEAFFILGTIQLVITFIVFIVVALEKKWGVLYSPVSTPTTQGTLLPEDEGGEFSEYSGSRSFTRYLRCGSKDVVIITALTSASLFIYDGLQSSYADYIYSYAEKNVDDLERSEGAVLNSCFWGPFALGRLIAVIVSTKISAAFMLSINMTGCGIALLLTLIFKTSRIAVYIGTCALGIFLSSMSPTAMALTEQFIRINAPITSCIVVFAALGETICPVIVGRLFVSAGPVSFLAFCFTLIIVSLLVFMILMVFGRDTARYRENAGRSFIWLTKSPPRQGESMEINSTFVPAHILLCIGMTGLPITMFLIPACRVLAQLLVNLMVMGWFMGCVDCVANLRVILRFGTHVTPFLQAMHFFYGLGAFVSPMIASPFLLNIDCSPFIDGYTVNPEEHTVNNQSVTIAPQPKVVDRAMQLSHSKEAFFILGTIQLVITFIVFIVVALEKKWGVLYSPASTPTTQGTLLPEDEGGEFSEYSGSRSFTRYLRCGSKDVVIITALTSASLFIYDGLQSSYADYIYSYAEKNVDDLERSEGAVLNSCFWGPFALGRLIAVVVSTKISAAFMLSINVTGCGIALLLTLIFKTSRIAVYIGTCALGIFLSSMSPTAMALTEQFIRINAPITSCIVVFAALGETICPVIVGRLFVSAGPVSFLAFCFTLVIVSLLVFVILMVFGRDTARYRENAGRSFIWLTKSPPRLGESMEINSTSVKYYSNHEDKSKDITSQSRDDNNKNGGDQIENCFSGNYR